MKYFIITYGCQMNQADSERIATDLEKRGYKPSSIIKEAGLIVVNMCSVRQQAVDRIFGMPMKLKGLRAKKVLTGCILKKDKKKFKELFDEIWEDKSYFKTAPKCQNKLVAYVPVSNGCDNFCTYCVVPFTRGHLTCRPHQAILKEANRLIKEGAKEVWLLGQNVNDYRSPVDSSINFARLIKKVGEMTGNFSVRFMSPHPKNFTDELIKTMAASPKIAKFINLPVQAGDNLILRKMNRGYTVEQYEKLVKKIRKAMPEVNLSTDVIVGFPGETKKQFENTVKLFKTIKFDIAYISKYSSRPGTLASKLKDNIPLEEKKRRTQILNKLTKHPS